MKTILLFLFLSVGCSSNRYYEAPKVSLELKKNVTRLENITANVTRDFAGKEAFYIYYTQQNKEKEGFILQDLRLRLMELENKKNTILAQASYIKSINEKLMNKLKIKITVREEDPLFNDIEMFSTNTKDKVRALFQDYEVYKINSDEFVRFTILTRNKLIKSTRYKRN